MKIKENQLKRYKLQIISGMICMECGSVIIITTYSEILHKHIEMQYGQLCLVEDSISFTKEYYDDYIKRSYSAYCLTLMLPRY